MTGGRERQLAVESEYGQPFWDVVRGYADDGESMQATAEILGMSPGSFRQLVRRNGKRGWFVDRSECNSTVAYNESRKGKPFPGGELALKRAVKRRRDVRWITRDGITDTLAGHCRRIGISYSTVTKRLYRGMSIEDALRKTSYVTQPKNLDHRWRTAA